MSRPGTDIADERLARQHLTRPLKGEPADVVAWFGAVQAQEYAVAKWGLGLRMAKATTDAAVARAVDEGQILRTHVMRPTWHFVTPADIRWMLELTAPRVQRSVIYMGRRFDIDAAVCRRATAIFERALAGGRFLTRNELGAALARKGIAAKGIALALMTIYAEFEGIICSGPYRGKHLTYALVAERAPRAKRLSRDEALAELTLRFFRGHGPATIKDFVWWSGLTTPDAKRGLEMNAARQHVVNGLTYWTVGPAQRKPSSPPPSGTVYLLPVYDEYFVAYRDRVAVPHGVGFPTPFQNPLTIDGQAAGTWKPVASKKGTVVHVAMRKRAVAAEQRAIQDAVERYGRFVGLPVSVAYVR